MTATVSRLHLLAKPLTKTVLPKMGDAWALAERRLRAAIRASRSVTAKRSFAAAPGAVRISGGHIKGRKLAVPDGAGVRPTTDRARETLFNVLTNRFRQAGGESILLGARVLDGFAGTGAMGVEAWSRGAAWISVPLLIDQMF